MEGIADGFRSAFGFARPGGEPARGESTSSSEQRPGSRPRPQEPTPYSAQEPTRYSAPRAGGASATSMPPMPLSDALRRSATPNGLAPGTRTVGGAYRPLPPSVRAPGAADPLAPPSPAGTSSARPLAAVRVYDASRPDAAGNAAFVADGIGLLGGSGPANARVAASHVQRGLQYYASTFGRDGIDGAGRGVDVVMNDRSTDASGQELFRGNGGYYVTRYSDGAVSEAIRFGTGTSYQHDRGGAVRQYEMAYADDLTIHELTHGVINAETGQVGGEADEAGAVNEALADVLAASATRDWRIGEGMYAPDSDYRALRNIADPTDQTAVHGLWTHVSQYEQAVAAGGHAEEHYASGIVSHAAFRMQQRLGGEAGWRAVEQLFYRTVTDGDLGDVRLSDAARALRATAGSMWGSGSVAYVVVDEELRRAGL